MRERVRDAVRLNRVEDQRVTDVEHRQPERELHEDQGRALPREQAVAQAVVAQRTAGDAERGLDDLVDRAAEQVARAPWHDQDGQHAAPGEQDQQTADDGADDVGNVHASILADGRRATNPASDASLAGG